MVAGAFCYHLSSRYSLTRPRLNSMLRIIRAMLHKSPCRRLIFSKKFQFALMNEETGKIYSFESFQVDPVRRRLLQNNRPVQIHSKTFDLLLALIENSGRVIEKDELMELVWPDQVVEEGNLTVKMSALRKALGERKDEARFIVTIPGRGYRFVADVKQVDAHEDALVIERRAVTHIVAVEEHEMIEEPAAAPISETQANGQASRQDNQSSIARVKSLPQTATVASASERKSQASLKYAVILASLVILLGLGAFGYRLYQQRGSKSATVPVSFQPAAFKRLTTNGKIASAAISPDGKYLVYAQHEGEGQSLWVRQVAESRSIQIMPTDPVEYWGLTFSPDSQQIYCTVFTPKKVDPDLLRVPTLGGMVERLPNVSCSSLTFSPDGKRFAYVVPNSGAGGVLLRVANADGTDDKVLAIMKYPSNFVFPEKTLSWSPDGETIACAAKIVSESGDYGTVLGVRVSDGQMFPIPKRRWPWVKSVSWLPDGSGLLLTANENAVSPMQIWHLSYTSGETRILSNDLNWYAWASVTADGERMLAVQQTTASSLWVADYENGIGTAKQIANEFGIYAEIAWTPEGRIVYRSGASGTFNLWMMDAEGTNRMQLTKDAMPDKGLAVSPDGRYIVFSSYRAGKYNLWRVDTDGSNLTQLTNGAGEIYPRITPDSRWVIYQQGVG